jgi:hypothetical protein
MPVVRADPRQRTGSASGMGITWFYDARDFLADVTVAGFTSNLDAWHRTEDAAVTVGMGVDLPLSRSNVAPYLGVGAAYAWDRFGGAWESGLQGRAMGGLLLGRLSTVAVRFEVGWFWNLATERELGTGRALRAEGGLASLTFLAAPGP